MIGLEDHRILREIVRTTNEKPCQEQVEYRQVALRFGVPVGVAGALFWTLKKTERWEKVPIARVRVK